MPVSTALTTALDFEAATTFTSIGGGTGGSVNSDIYIQGTQSAARRADNTTNQGFWVDNGTNFNMSAAGTHVKFWFWHTHYAGITNPRFRLGTSTTAYREFAWPSASYPRVGGWVPVWMSITGGGGTDTGVFNNASVRFFATVCNTPDIGGTSQNLIIDEILYGTAGLRWTGTSGTFQSFRSYEETNVEGVLLSANGVDACYSRLTFGNGSTATTFSDSGFTLLFPSQPLVSSSWMGLTFDLSLAGDTYTFSNALFGSGDPVGAQTRPDLIVTGTVAPLTFTGVTFQGLRALQLNQAVTMSNCLVRESGQINATFGGSGSLMAGTTVSSYSGSTGTAALLWSSSLDPFGELDNMTFEKGTRTTHAIEFSSNSPTTLTLVGHTYTGYNVLNNQNDSTVWIRRTTGTVTIDVLEGDSPTYRTDGATVVINNPVTLQITGLIPDSEVRIYDANTNEEITGTESSSGTFTYNYNYTVDTDIFIVIFHLNYVEIRLVGLILGNENQTIPVQQRTDRVYSNP